MAVTVSGVSCAGGEAAQVNLYVTVAPTPVPQQTQAINPAWLESNGETLGTDVASGTYWATVGGVGVGAEPFVDFDLSRAFFGAACTQQFGADVDSCANGFGVAQDPHGTLPAFKSKLAIVTVVGSDQRNYAITADELIALIGGTPPADEAPDDYQYAAYPFLVTVSGGAITAARQIWTP
jgi:hypothetical protein